MPSKAVTPNHAEREHDQIVKYLLSAVSTFNANRSCEVCGFFRTTENLTASEGTVRVRVKKRKRLLVRRPADLTSWYLGGVVS